MDNQDQISWFQDVETIISEPLNFKAKLAIGEDAYTSLKVKNAAFQAWEVAGVATTAAVVAKSSLVASTFFAPSGFLAAIGFLVALWLTPNFITALVIPITLLLVVVCGTLSGSLLPLLFSRLGWDPALMSNPFVAGIIDILGILIYMNVALWLIPLSQ